MLLVTCALLLKENKTFVAQRSATMSPPLKWEFPGGKIESGESPEDCIAREMQEEFRLEVKPIFQAPDFPFPNTHNPKLTLIPFVCKLVSGHPLPVEHAGFQWAELSELDGFDWAEADLPVLDWWKNNIHRF